MTKHTCVLQVYEVLDNSIDEVQAGFATLVQVCVCATGLRQQSHCRMHHRWSWMWAPAG